MSATALNVEETKAMVRNIISTHAPHLDPYEAAGERVLNDWKNPSCDSCPKPSCRAGHITVIIVGGNVGDGAEISVRNEESNL